jgi:hypothetical protein
VTAGGHKERIENRLEELAEIVAAAVGGFSVMDDPRNAFASG